VNDSSTIIPRRNEPALVPHAATLDGFVDGVAGSRGTDVRNIEPLTTMHIRTRNSHYRVVLTGGTSAIVQGGHFFPDPTPARIDGSGFGGSFLKVAWVAIGLSMEIFANGQRIVTSAVREITFDERTAALLH
jgi:hypothetical protein